MATIHWTKFAEIATQVAPPTAIVGRILDARAAKAKANCGCEEPKGTSAAVPGATVTRRSGRG
jgi:hypothetical protein